MWHCTTETHMMGLTILEHPFSEDGGVLGVSTADGDKGLTILCIGIETRPCFVSP